MQDTDLKLRSDRLKLVTGCIDNYQGRQRQKQREGQRQMWLVLSAGVFELLAHHLTFINGHSLACNDLYPLQQLAPHC